MKSIYKFLFKSGKVMPACNPNTEEAEAGWSWVQGKIGLPNEFQASLGYIARPCLKSKEQNKTAFIHFQV